MKKIYPIFVHRGLHYANKKLKFACRIRFAFEKNGAILILHGKISAAAIKK